jgi:hypothetical protein
MVSSPFAAKAVVTALGVRYPNAPRACRDARYSFVTTTGVTIAACETR